MEDLINDLICPSVGWGYQSGVLSCFSSILSHILYFKAFWVGYSPSCLNRYSVRVRQKVDATNADMKQSWSISCFHQFVSLWNSNHTLARHSWILSLNWTSHHDCVNTVFSFGKYLIFTSIVVVAFPWTDCAVIAIFPYYKCLYPHYNIEKPSVSTVIYIYIYIYIISDYRLLRNTFSVTPSCLQ